MIQKMPPHRSHIEALCFMRSSHLQRRKFAADSVEDLQDDARVGLLQGEDRLEAGQCVAAPGWAGRVEGLNYQMSRLESRLAELDSLHVRLLTRPGLGEDEDGGDGERSAKMTEEMMRQLAECNKQLAALQRLAKSLRRSEARVLGNIVTSLASRLQEVAGRLRTSQGRYLRRLEDREQRSSQYFTHIQPDTETEDDGLLIVSSSGSGVLSQDMIQLEESTKMLRKRDQDIGSIVNSLQDLNTLFRDLAAMVSEQGEVVDRIDYNIEMSAARVESGLEQLQKAAKYQKSNAKMKCIVLLGFTLILLIFILIVSKT